jgi:hypothetical protein
VSGTSIETVWLDGRPVGRAFEDDHARYCVLGNLCSHDLATSRDVQARGTLENLEKGLALVGMDLSSVPGSSSVTSSSGIPSSMLSGARRTLHGACSIDTRRRAPASAVVTRIMQRSLLLPWRCRRKVLTS